MGAPSASAKDNGQGHGSDVTTSQGQSHDNGNNGGGNDNGNNGGGNDNGNNGGGNDNGNNGGGNDNKITICHFVHGNGSTGEGYNVITISENGWTHGHSGGDADKGSQNWTHDERDFVVDATHPCPPTKYEELVKASASQWICLNSTGPTQVTADGNGHLVGPQYTPITPEERAAAVVVDQPSADANLANLLAGSGYSGYSVTTQSGVCTTGGKGETTTTKSLVTAAAAAAAAEAATVPEEPLVVAAPAAGTVPTEEPLAVAVPQKATVPAAVPAGDGSSDQGGPNTGLLLLALAAAGVCLLATGRLVLARTK